MPDADPMELLRAIRTTIQRSQSELGDPRAAAAMVVPSLNSVAQGLPKYLGANQIAGPLGDTLLEIARLLDAILQQLAEVQADKTDLGSTGE